MQPKSTLLGTTLNDQNHPDHTSKVLHEFQKKNVLVDFTISTICQQENLTFECHRFVLARSCLYFREMFEKENINFYQIPTHPNAIKAVLDYLYHGELELSSSNMFGIALLSSKLHLVPLMNHCLTFAQEHLTYETVVQYLNIVGEIASENNDLQNAGLSFMINNFKTIYNSEWYQPTLYEMRFEHLIAVLKSDELNVSSEEDVLNCVVQWCNINDLEQVSSLFDVVRLEVIHMTKVSGLINTLPKDLQMDIFEQWLKRHGAKEVSSRMPQTQKMREAILVSIDDQHTIMSYHKTTMKWKPVGRIPTWVDVMTSTSACDSSLIFTGSLYQSYISRVFISSNEEVILPDMIRHRYSHGSIVCRDKLYVIGGVHMDDEIKKYVPTKSLDCLTLDSTVVQCYWCSLSPMLVETQHPLVASDGDDGFYVLGGRHHDESSRHVHYYDVRGNQWAIKPDMPISCCSLTASACVLDDEIIVVTNTSVMKYNITAQIWQYDACDPPGGGDVFGCLHDQEVIACVTTDHEECLIKRYNRNKSSWQPHPDITPPPTMLRKRYLFCV